MTYIKKNKIYFQLSLYVMTQSDLKTNTSEKIASISLKIKSSSKKLLIIMHFEMLLLKDKFEVWKVLVMTSDNFPD